MMINSLKGTRDIFSPEIEIWQYLEEISRNLFKIYSYQEIRTPIIEQTSLFSRSIGQATDIVQKEMYSFIDKGRRTICLRPEETASVVRAYVQHGFYQQKQINKFYYIGPMFRSERPQAGRMRQFHQIGVEAIGAANPLIDVEVIMLLNEILRKIGIKRENYFFKINSLGCFKDRESYQENLSKHIKPHLKKLCAECQNRFNLNVLRMLDCKNERCRGILSASPSITQHLCGECGHYFEQVVTLLEKFDIVIKKDHHLVRGLDYYTGITFEVTAKDLGAQNALAAGGRYNNLVKELGGPETGACGFAAGMERLISCMPERIIPAGRKKPSVYVVCLESQNSLKGFEVISELRRNGITAEMDYLGRTLKSQMRQADAFNSTHTILIGEDEIKSGTFTVKNMENGRQEKILQKNLLDVFNSLD